MNLLEAVKLLIVIRHKPYNSDFICPAQSIPGYPLESAEFLLSFRIRRHGCYKRLQDMNDLRQLYGEGFQILPFGIVSGILLHISILDLQSF